MEAIFPSFPNFHLGTHLEEKLCFDPGHETELRLQFRSQIEIWERGPGKVF
jgi:hypothetical protein